MPQCAAIFRSAGVTEFTLRSRLALRFAAPLARAVEAATMLIVAKRKREMISLTKATFD